MSCFHVIMLLNVFSFLARFADIILFSNLERREETYKYFHVSFQMILLDAKQSVRFLSIDILCNKKRKILKREIVKIIYCV